MSDGQRHHLFAQYLTGAITKHNAQVQGADGYTCRNTTLLSKRHIQSVSIITTNGFSNNLIFFGQLAHNAGYGGGGKVRSVGKFNLGHTTETLQHLQYLVDIGLTQR